MQRELTECAMAGYRVMNGVHQPGASLLVQLEKVAQPPDAYAHQLIATQRTTTMQKEMNQAAAQGFHLLPGKMIGGRGKPRKGARPVRCHRVSAPGNQSDQHLTEGNRTVRQPGLPRGWHDQPRREHRNPRKTRRN